MREGSEEFLRTLPGLVVCGGLRNVTFGSMTREVWRLRLGKLQWERMPSLTHARVRHGCCVVRGRVAVLGGFFAGHTRTSDVEILGCADSEETWKALPHLSCGPFSHGVVLAIDETESELGQVLLFGGVTGSSSAVHTVDLATGVCTPQPSSFNPTRPLAARLPDGRIVCSGNDISQQTVKVLGPPDPGSPNGASWQWIDLPSTSVARRFCGGCVMSDGRFAVFGGLDGSDMRTSSCEALTISGSDARWDPLRLMHQARAAPACAAIGGCVIVAGGVGSVTVEVYEEGLGRWRRLPCNLPDSAGTWMGSAVYAVL
jgi:hypothetical protein